MKKKKEHIMLNELKMQRHSWELPLYASNIVFTIAIAINIFLIGTLSFLFDRLGLDYSGPGEFVASLGLEAFGAITIFLFSIFLILSTRGIYYAYAAHFGLKVTKDNFNELYEKAEEIAISLGMKKAPEIFIINKKGLVSSGSSKALRKPFITLSYELVETAYAFEDKNFDAVNFAIAREMAHHALGHNSYRVAFLTFYSRFLPFIGPALSRSWEYSADKGASVILNGNVAKAFTSYIVGGNLYRYVNAEAAANAKIGGLTHGAFMRLLYNTYAWMPLKLERLRALEKTEKNGKMFF